jgi:hypothetical protein
MTLIVEFPPFWLQLGLEFNGYLIIAKATLGTKTQERVFHSKATAY